MSDHRKGPLDDLGDLDWDRALDEWEQASFSPEAARDADDPSAPAPERTVVAPFPLDFGEEPPTSEGGRITTAPPPTAEAPRRSALPSPTPNHLSSPPARPSGAAARGSLPPSIRGGLDQLFSRRPAAPPRPEPIATSSERTKVGSLADDDFARAARSLDLPRIDEDSETESEATARRASPLEPESGPSVANDPIVDLAEVPENETVVRPPTAEAEAVLHASASHHAPSSTPRSRAPAPDAPVSFEGEQPGSGWLDERAALAFRSRVEWLEEEARARMDPAERGRALLAVSELCALTGDFDRARAIAVEAREVSPDLALARQQARQLMPRDPHALAESLDEEAARAPTLSARVHSALLAADLLRATGGDEAATERWENACALDPTDARAPIARAARALAQNDHTSSALRRSGRSELTALDKAIATALRLRGVERPDTDAEAMPINDGLRRARAALAAGDVVTAATSAGEIAAAPELGDVSRGALWLSAAFGAAHVGSRRAAARALKTLADDGDALASRQLAARGVELGDPELVADALSDASAFDLAERVTLAILAAPEDGADTPVLTDQNALDGEPALAPLSDAIAAMHPASHGDPDEVAMRATRAAGAPAARGLTTLGRLLASNANDDTVAEALDEVTSPLPPTALGVVLEAAIRAQRWGELSVALSRLPSGASAPVVSQHLAAAMIAERAGHHEGAKHAWIEAARSGAAHDGLVRIAADVAPELELGAELLRVAESMPDGIASAVLRLEALARGAVSDEEERRATATAIHDAAPSLGLGAFLGERIALRKGDVDEVLRWIHERRAYATDPLEMALDAVREAFLVADRDPEVASTRLDEAHRARPDDVALRELYERLATEPLSDRGTWRERRAEQAKGAPAALLWVDAALEHERAGDAEKALQAARKAAEAGDVGFSTLVVERAEIATGNLEAQRAALLAIANVNASGDVSLRRGALERLALLEADHDERARAHHRAILEETPGFLPSLRRLEHGLIGDGSDADLLPIFERIAMALDGTSGGECAAHAQHAARLRARDAAGGEGPGAWERTHDMAHLAATQPAASLWALRALNAHARAQRDERAVVDTTLALLDRTQRSHERAALLVRASEAATRLAAESPDAADGAGGLDVRALLEQAAAEDPGDVVTWGFLAEVRERAGDPRAAAEACESLARTSAVPEHQLLAWNDAAKMWLDEVGDPERGMTALEAAAAIDPAHADVVTRLSALYSERGLDAELARLLEARLDTVEDEDERIGLTVDLARALEEMGEVARAKAVLEGALELRPSHTTGLAVMAELCVREADWAGAEHAYVRLARLLADPAEQRAVYERLGEIYAVHAPNLSRAETAFNEVLKRAPDDLATVVKLVDVYKRQGDAPRAAEAQQRLVAGANAPDARLAALVELAKIHESVGRDPRKSEQVLDSARKEFPTSVVALRAMAEFYARQRQMPAMQILLDRSAADARRAFAQGRFVPSLFQVLHAAFELRGKRDAARVVAATLAAVEGHPSDLVGADAPALDPRLDDLLAPELMSPALRALLFHTGDALDAVAPLDLRVLNAAPLPPSSPLAATIGSVATMIGLGALQVFVSPHLGRVAIPVASMPPILLVGQGLANARNERARTFVVVRAIKMILARAGVMVRGTAQEVSALVAALLTAMNPSYTSRGFDAARIADLSRRIGAALPRNLDPTTSVIALEAGGRIGAQGSALPSVASMWANRVALLAVGDPNAALEAIAWSVDQGGAPTAPEERAAWIARHPEARDLMTFSVTDAYAEARIRLGLDR